MAREPDQCGNRFENKYEDSGDRRFQSSYHEQEKSVCIFNFMQLPARFWESP